ncbi:hypothetical protein MRB53_037422 [Persea americana]|nr:hypothetical protein MRB53_037422 [Persea americana]
MAVPHVNPIETYNSEQIEAYYNVISLPLKYRLFPSKATRAIARGPAGPALDFLAALQSHHICAIPYENLVLHYSTSPGVCLDKEKLFQKIVTKGHGRGGYCMEVNYLYLTILRSLGFRVFPAGARVHRCYLTHRVEDGYIG